MQGDLFHNQGPRRRIRLRYIVPVIVALPFIAIAVGAALVASSSSSIRLDSHSLARVSLPLGGGTITQVVAIGGREQKVVPVRLVGHQILPVGKLAPGSGSQLRRRFAGPAGTRGWPARPSA